MTRRALVYCNPSSATLVGYVIHCAYFWTLTILFGALNLIDWRALVFFAFAGFLAPGLGRWLRVIAIDRIGAPVSSTVVSSTPIFAIASAAALLEERITLQLLTGTLLVILGVLTFQWKASGGKSMRTGIILAVICAACFGTSATVRQLGLNLSASPILAGAIGSSASLLLFSILFKAAGTRISMSKQALKLVLPASILEGLGITSLIYSYMAVGVVLTESLVNMTPLLVIAMSMVFLREFEKVTFRILLGAIVTVTGAGLVILS